MTTINNRSAAYSIDPIFLERWSPRAFTSEPIAVFDLLAMLEAARWAPSSSNAQPWRFLYARRDTPQWLPFLDLLVPNNRSWAAHASALAYLVSNTTMAARDGSGEVLPPTHSFDTGTASGYMACKRIGWDGPFTAWRASTTRV